MRELKALELAARAKIVHGDDGIWSVPSQTAGRVYRVVTWPGAETCECEDFQLRQLPCKHIIAAKLVEEREGKRPAPPMDTDTPPERKTYSQNWPAYNLAQTTEKHRLQELLADLCRGVPEPAYAGTGRRSVPMADRLFAMTFKVYCLMSHRRFGCDLSDAHDRGYLTRILHPSKVSSFLCDPELTPILHELIARSAAPLKAVETKFAVDSSGFSACKFGRWFDAKYGIDRWEREWVKVHACTGVKTGVTTAIRVTGKDGGDCPQFLPLVADTGKGFTVKEVSADKAYLSTENVDLVAALGGECFIPPKSNTTGGVGGLFAKMVGYYQFRRDEFLQHYHSRSNVESLFSAVKRKFGDWVRCRNEAGMVNEVLCKFLCNNLCCVILSQIELGIDAEFWKGKDDGARDVLPLVRRG